MLYVGCRSARHWTATKKSLDFCEVTQDCDEEGCIRLHELPTVDQAVAIREALGIRKRRDLGVDELERLRRFAFGRAEAALNG